MPLSIYDAAFPHVIRALKAQMTILDKAAAFCQVRKIDQQVLLDDRLAPDMYPYLRQVQIVTDQAKGMAARLAGQEVPSYPDDETSFEGLKTRLAKTIDFVESIPREAVDGSEDREILLKLRGEERKLTGRDYLFGFMLPNFYFHATTAYDILRHAGVELGKRDFLGMS